MEGRCVARKTLTALAISLALVSTAEAASFNCGRWMCGHLGISKEQCRKMGLPLALQWPKKFQRVTLPAPGVVVVQKRNGMDASGKRQGGHVAVIVRPLDASGNYAIVRDNRGTYRRNIAKNRVALVQPSRPWTEAGE